MRKSLLLALCFFVATSGFAAKKAKVPEVDVLTWSINQNDLVPEADGIKLYRLNSRGVDNKSCVKGTIAAPSVQAEDAYVAAMLSTLDSLDPDYEKVTDIDLDKHCFTVCRDIITGEGKDEINCRFVTKFNFTDGMITFETSKINIEIKELGLIPRVMPVDRFKPSNNERHRSILEQFALIHSRAINDIRTSASNATKHQITHWNDIKSGRVVKGMNEAEVKLIGGKPREVSPSGNDTQWMYSNNFVVLFTDGVVTSVMQ